MANYYAEDMRRWARDAKDKGQTVSSSDLEVAADHVDRLTNKLHEQRAYIEMVLKSVEGGGYVVTFSDMDIAQMKRLTDN